MVYFFSYRYIGQDLVAAGMAASFLLGVIALFLNHRGHYFYSRHLFLITCNLVVAFADTCFHFKISAEAYYLPATLISFLLFERSDHKHIAIAITFPIIFWFFPRILSFDSFFVAPPLSLKEEVFLNYFNFFGAIILTNYFALSFFRSLSDFQKALITTNKFSALGEMSAGIAHEINNPVAIIIGKAQSLQKRIGNRQVDMSTITSDLKKIESTTQRIAKIVKGLKSFSRTGESDPFQDVPVATIVEDVLSLCQEKLKHTGVQIHISVQAGQRLRCRQNQIEQVLLNLIGNAADAIAEIKDPWIRIETAKTIERFQIHVVDCGLGIPQDVVEKMMDPFFTTKEVGKGTGLGLSISKGLVEDHGGILRYDQESAHTRFVLDFPATFLIESSLKITTVA